MSVQEPRGSSSTSSQISLDLGRLPSPHHFAGPSTGPFQASSASTWSLSGQTSAGSTLSLSRASVNERDENAKKNTPSSDNGPVWAICEFVYEYIKIKYASKADLKIGHGSN